ncbi:MAG TPA: esterase-like activity of phytase family protein [Rhizobiaceae bacterium]|nr:esterase-like activity of phytase family protein [Rhizobiaceae bacterium]
MKKPSPAARPSRRIVGWAAAAALLLAIPLPPASGQAPVARLEVSSRPITQFHIGHQTKDFGPLEFIGGLEMVSRGRHFGALSSFRFLSPGGDFVGVADTGFWFFGKVVRDEAQRPVGIADFTMQAMVDAKGNALDEKQYVDAEGLEVKDGVATVGFERQHRVAQFRIEPKDMKAPIRELDFVIPRRELRQNKGFETVVQAPAGGPLEGSIVLVSERSLDEEGNIFAAILEGPGKGIFKVKRDDGFDITDGAFLPNGDLLLLERRFAVADGVAMRLRRIDGETIRAGRVADGRVLLSADMGYQIDNMEGLDVWRRADGALMVSVISDDNHSLFQRNLYLEFQLHED